MGYLFTFFQELRIILLNIVSKSLVGRHLSLQRRLRLEILTVPVDLFPVLPDQMLGQLGDFQLLQVALFKITIVFLNDRHGLIWHDKHLLVSISLLLCSVVVIGVLKCHGLLISGLVGSRACVALRLAKVLRVELVLVRAGVEVK